MRHDTRVFEALLRNDFRAFLQKTFYTLCPGQLYDHNWHLEAIAWLNLGGRGQKVTALVVEVVRRDVEKNLRARRTWIERHLECRTQKMHVWRDLPHVILCADGPRARGGVARLRCAPAANCF